MNKNKKTISIYPDKIPGEFWGKVKSVMGGKVDKVKGKGLSTNDYTTEDKIKVDNLNSITNKQIDELFGKGEYYGIP